MKKLLLWNNKISRLFSSAEKEAESNKQEEEEEEEEVSFPSIDFKVEFAGPQLLIISCVWKSIRNDVPSFISFASFFLLCSALSVCIVHKTKPTD